MGKSCPRRKLPLNLSVLIKKSFSFSFCLNLFGKRCPRKWLPPWLTQKTTKKKKKKLLFKLNKNVIFQSSKTQGNSYCSPFFCCYILESWRKLLWKQIQSHWLNIELYLCLNYQCTMGHFEPPPAPCVSCSYISALA